MTKQDNSRQKRFELSIEQQNAIDMLIQGKTDAVEVLADDLQSTDKRARRAAAVHVLKCVGMYGAYLLPSGDTEPEQIERVFEWDAFGL